jgi:SWI/SNF-related matrix-associated actin-dependent regulator 1 of chromatin subfamily A
MIELLPHQKKCADFHFENEYTLNGSTMGTGKSAIAIEFMRLTGEKGLVVGPTFLRENWLREGAKFGYTNFDYIPISQIHKYNKVNLAQYGVWVIDEIHYIKNPTAKRTKEYYTLVKAVKPKYWLGLSGTIIKNKVFDLWVPLAICTQCPSGTINGKHLTGSHTRYRGFASYFCHTDIIRIRDARIERFGRVKEELIPELKSYLEKKYIRFSLDDVVKDMPELVEKEVDIDVDCPDGLEEEFVAYMEGSKSDPTAKAASALLKVDATLKYMEIFVENNEPAIIFTDHRESAYRLARGLKCPSVTGKSKSEDRVKHVDDFQAGKIQFLVCTIGAMSVGVTLTRARNVVFNDLSWTHADNQQARARIHRIGQKNICIAHYIIGSETDAYIKRAVEAKAKTSQKVLGHE